MERPTQHDEEIYATYALVLLFFSPKDGAGAKNYWKSDRNQRNTQFVRSKSSLINFYTNKEYVVFNIFHNSNKNEGVSLKVIIDLYCKITNRHIKRRDNSVVHTFQFEITKDYFGVPNVTLADVRACMNFAFPDPGDDNRHFTLRVPTTLASDMKNLFLSRQSDDGHDVYELSTVSIRYINKLQTPVPGLMPGLTTQGISSIEINGDGDLFLFTDDVPINSFPALYTFIRFDFGRKTIFNSTVPALQNPSREPSAPPYYL